MSGVEVSGIESDIEVSEIEMSASGIEVSGSGQRLVPTGTNHSGRNLYFTFF